LFGTFYVDIRVRKMTRIHEMKISVTKPKATGMHGKTYKVFK